MADFGCGCRYVRPMLLVIVLVQKCDSIVSMLHRLIQSHCKLLHHPHEAEPAQESIMTFGCFLSSDGCRVVSWPEESAYRYAIFMAHFGGTAATARCLNSLFVSASLPH